MLDATVTGVLARLLPWLMKLKACRIPVRACRCLTFLAALTAVLLAALACALGPGAAEHNEMSMTINRIAYIDADGQLVTSNPDGSGRNLLTTGAVARAGGILAQPQRSNVMYSWPVWSPDGSRIAVSLLRGDSPSDAQISLHSLESSTGVGGAAFVNEAPLTIAEGIRDFLVGDFARALAAIGLAACGFLAFAGRMPWGVAIAVIAGIVLVFGAVTMVEEIADIAEGEG